MAIERPDPERGGALILTLLLLLALLALGVSFLAVSLTDREIAANETDSARALEMSHAGIEEARVALVGMDFDALLVAGAIFTNRTLADGKYTVTVTNNVTATSLAAADPGGATDDTDRILILTSTGESRKARRRTEVLVTLPVSDFAFGFWANTKITISGGGITDSYNSAAGPYTSGTGTDGDIFCNGDITLSGGSTTVNGDASSGTTVSGGIVTGTRTNGAPTQTILPVACPGSYTAAADVPSGGGITYNAATGKLTVSSTNLTLTAPPTSYYFSELTLSGSASLTVNGGGQHVDIYVADKLTVSGNGIVNTASDPTRLTLWACGPSTNDWTLSGGSGAYFAVHAPTRKVTISGSGDVWGAIVGKEITSSGGSQMHYDTALGGGGVANVIPRSWHELFL